MNKLNHIESLMRKIAEKGLTPDSKQLGDIETVSVCTDAYVAYHNEAVKQGELITLARIRMDEDKFVRYVENLHERRKDMHTAMINATIRLNSLCGEYGLPGIYDGPLDRNKKRDDPDTRFGVAEFSEMLCRDFFKTTELIGIPDKAREAWHKYRDSIKSDYDESGRKKQSSTVTDMLRKAAALNDMDAGSPGDGPDF